MTNSSQQLINHWDALGFRAFRRIARTSKERTSQLLQFSSCDLADVMHKSHAMRGIRPVHVTGRVAGPAITVSVPSGGLNVIKYAADLLEDGDVLVVDAQADVAYALWGGNVSRGIQARGAAALVIDGAVRDVSEIRDLGFPVYARGVATAFREHSVARGEINVPISCGGIVVNPGDIVVCDEDGVVAIPPQALDSVVKRATAQQEKFAAIQPILLRGEVTSIDDIVESLHASGICQIDAAYGAEVLNTSAG